MNCNNSTGVYGLHREGANVLMCDGAVRFFTQRTNVFVMYAVVSRNGGEIYDLNNPEY